MRPLHPPPQTLPSVWSSVTWLQCNSDCCSWSKGDRSIKICCLNTFLSVKSSHSVYVFKPKIMGGSVLYNNVFTLCISPQRFLTTMIYLQFLHANFCQLQVAWSDLIWNKSDTMEHLWSDQLTATGCRFTAIAVSISTCSTTNLYSTNHSRWQQKILLSKCFRGTAAYSFLSLPIVCILKAHLALARCADTATACCGSGYSRFSLKNLSFSKTDKKMLMLATSWKSLPF